MTLHHAQEARGRKMKNNFTLFALNIRRQSVGDRATDGSGDDCEKTGQSLWMGEESTDTAGTNVGGVEDVNRYRTRKKKVSTEVQFGVSPLGNREFHTYDKMLHISQAFPA